MSTVNIVYRPCCGLMGRGNTSRVGMSKAYSDAQLVLVLGFYDRDNAGDDLYKWLIPRCLHVPTHNFVFRSMDDVEEIPQDTYDFIICGGGDIINAYFMSKAERLLSTFAGRVYAFSVGIPYRADARYLHLFDHVFVRSRADYALAARELGTRNVTHMPDLAMAMPRPSLSASAQGPRVRLGICLAQPAFHDNAAADEMVRAIATAVSELSCGVDGLEVHLLSFNRHEASRSECDLVVNAALAAALSALGVAVQVRPGGRDLRTPQDIYTHMARHVDVVLGMRYHSVIFALNLYKPLVALYCSPKVDHLAVEFRDNIDAVYRLETRPNGQPTACDPKRLLECLDRAFHSRERKKPPLPDVALGDYIDVMFKRKQTADVLIKSDARSGPGRGPCDFDDALFTCRKALAEYLGVCGTALVQALARREPFDVGGRDREGVARLVCYALTRNVSSPYLWGLAENMLRADFCMDDAIRYIYDDARRAAALDATQSTERYYPKTGVPRSVFVSLDSLFHNDYSGYHRSGWGYVVGGMTSMMDAHRLLRRASMSIDTYVDRSFHWGHDTLQVMGLIPYREPWMGVIHHTFDETHSAYNCRELFAKPLFVESLRSCRGLVTLTEYLAGGVRGALRALGLQDSIPVHVLYHPMETVDRMFSMEAFLGNARRLVVQIGAWLRNPYAIYELPLGGSDNPLHLTKAALKGKEMDQYFRPAWLFERLHSTLLATSDGLDAGQSQGAGKSLDMCRPVNGVNKYCAGLYDAILHQDQSVTVLERMSNEQYDRLLSENVVFLNLVDCSAVNTVLECLVRNTPLVVNRHPAVEEMLGARYPGFYRDLYDAAAILKDVRKLAACHAYLKTADKSRFDLGAFLQQFQGIIRDAQPPAVAE